MWAFDASDFEVTSIVTVAEVSQNLSKRELNLLHLYSVFCDPNIDYSLVLVPAYANHHPIIDDKTLQIMLP